MMSIPRRPRADRGAPPGHRTVRCGRDRSQRGALRRARWQRVRSTRSRSPRCSILDGVPPQPPRAGMEAHRRAAAGAVSGLGRIPRRAATAPWRGARVALLGERVANYSPSTSAVPAWSTGTAAAACSRSATSAAATARQIGRSERSSRARGRPARVTSGEVRGPELESRVRRILEIDPRNPQANMRLGFVLQESGRCADAGQYFTAASPRGFLARIPILALPDARQRRDVSMSPWQRFATPTARNRESGRPRQPRQSCCPMEGSRRPPCHRSGARWQLHGLPRGSLRPPRSRWHAWATGRRGPGSRGTAASPAPGSAATRRGPAPAGRGPVGRESLGRGVARRLGRGVVGRGVGGRSVARSGSLRASLTDGRAAKAVRYRRQLSRPPRPRDPATRRPSDPCDPPTHRPTDPPTHRPPDPDPPTQRPSDPATKTTQFKFPYPVARLFGPPVRPGHTNGRKKQSFQRLNLCISSRLSGASLAPCHSSTWTIPIF